MKTKQPDSLIKNVLRWSFTIIAVALLVRLAITLFSLVFNFSGTPIGRLINEGTFFERINDVSPNNIAIQIAIIIVVVTILIISKKTKRKSDEKSTSENNERP